ncbi:hypothetical protein JTB14_001543 [Gonioctena quinquepunctata]|nr:hypothetical protein JTB14_001543 [Gonioctena quinquepunctata]
MTEKSRKLIRTRWNQLHTDLIRLTKITKINSKDWCKYGSAGGKCNIKCEALIDENIRDDSVCAQKIQAELGFLAWEGWKRSCYGRSYTSTIVSTCNPKK